MAKALATFEFPHGGRKGIEYDWDSILDGKIWSLTQGEDFDNDVTAKTFVGAVARQANTRELRVKRDISKDGKTVVLQAVPKGATPATPATPEPAKTPAKN
jgi:hypothetical protein